MPPAYALPRHTTSLATALQLGLRHVPRLLGLTNEGVGATARRILAKREVESGSPEFIVFACLIPILVLLSGLFAGLTLGCVADRHYYSVMTRLPLSQLDEFG
jgi:metal transporter CNNM